MIYIIAGQFDQKYKQNTISNFSQSVSLKFKKFYSCQSIF